MFVRCITTLAFLALGAFLLPPEACCALRPAGRLLNSSTETTSSESDAPSPGCCSCCTEKVSQSSDPGGDQASPTPKSGKSPNCPFCLKSLDPVDLPRLDPPEVFGFLESSGGILELGCLPSNLKPPAPQYRLTHSVPLWLLHQSLLC